MLTVRENPFYRRLRCGSNLPSCISHDNELNTRPTDLFWPRLGDPKLSGHGVEWPQQHDTNCGPAGLIDSPIWSWQSHLNWVILKDPGCVIQNRRSWQSDPDCTHLATLDVELFQVWTVDGQLFYGAVCNLSTTHMPALTLQSQLGQNISPCKQLQLPLLSFFLHRCWIYEEQAFFHVIVPTANICVMGHKISVKLLLIFILFHVVICKLVHHY